jgi:hypothetical protein
MQPYLALITPIGAGHPDQGLPGAPPPQPSHPIVLPGVPDPYPGSPSHPIYITGNPSQPIYIPPGYWGGSNPHPDQGLPGSQPHPDQGLPPNSGGQPSHPIAGLPPGVPTHPITLPKPLPPPPDDIADKVVVAVWNPETDVWKVSVGDPQPKPTPHK